MDEDWWPDLLAHIPKEDPWAEPNLLVAEIRSFDDPWLKGTRILWSALVPIAELEALEGKLIAFNYEVESTGRPSPGLNVAGTLEPRFWIGAYAAERHIEFEPLIFGWGSHNNTALVLDPRFAMTYGLMPRGLADGSTHWDNLAEPEFDVAVISAPSVYEDLQHSGARAVIARDYLQDYLTLRGMALVHVYYENRRGERDDAIDALLGDEDRVCEKLSTREVDVQRRREGGFLAQIWGARVVAMPGALPITADPLEENGLVWPGIDSLVTKMVANRFRPWNHVYVRDSVLAAYEGKPGFHVSPETGGVGYGNQWSVGPADRVGRDVIRLEIRKLYEGTPHRVVRHWNAYAITPTPDLLGAEGRKARNVGTRSKELVYAMADIGMMLCGIAAMFPLEAVGTEDYVGLDRAWLTYNGWWNGAHVEPITRHIPVDMSRSEFLSRCLDLDKVLVEALGERRLRRLVTAFGTPHDKIDKFRGLKLLDRIICLCQVAVDAGLAPWKSGEEVVARYAQNGTDPAQPLAKLFALSDLRQAAGHRKDLDAEIAPALERFGLDLSATRGGWGLVMDQIYDQLSEQLAAIHETLKQTLRLA
ncbi:hypothetical protein [Sphingobium fuliginis]|uniref:Uncharacterized protein n=1 Tax=Sphingobium fuliginis ATCC 27551 TaxID=1208342 RepID=A0A5B8CH06_SPHSA|nr:hypothetical protein [Sphingobium fuliginis]QDC37280.1 hypothetical protein FIL70_08655 [Sphingobium fuliginis ATCC 27551]